MSSTPVVRNAVLSDTHVFFAVGGRLKQSQLVGQLTNVSQLFEIAMQLRCRVLWVPANTRASALATREWIAQVNKGWKLRGPRFVDKDLDSEEHAMCIPAYKAQRAEHESSNTFYIMFAEHCDGWSLDTINEPVSLLAAIAYAEDALQETLIHKPPTVGFRILNAALQKTCPQVMDEQEEILEDGATKKKPPIIKKLDLEAISPVLSTRVKDISFKRNFTADELQQMQASGLSYVIAYDKSSMYPAAATGTLLGIGDPVYVESPVFDAKKIKPGLWHCRIHGTSIFDSPHLPHPTDNKKEGWFYTYTVQLLIDLGYTVEITEAYVWEEGKVLLRNWIEKLWTARSVLDDRSAQCDKERYVYEDARHIACSLIKPIMNSTLGLIDRFRHDWYMLVMDRARCLMFRRIQKFLSPEHAILFGVATDCLYYISSIPSPLVAVPGMMDRHGIGSFRSKFHGALPLDAIESMLCDNSCRIGKVDTLLSKIDRSN